ncbi:MAG: HAMP domain-containing sensor histidine kinase [Vicinamibacteria bacterium]
MTIQNLGKLSALIRRDRETLLARWRSQVRLLPSARGLDTPTLNDHMPSLLDELKEALEAHTEQSIAEALLDAGPKVHGLQRVQDGFDIEEVVSEYNILRACIHDLADDNGINLQGRAFHIINRVFDHAIGLALQSYATRKALETQSRREEYLAFVAHDLRTPLNAISLAGRVLEVSLVSRDVGPEASVMLKSLRRNVQRLEGLVSKVLEENTNLRTEVGVKVERREFDLWPLVESLIHDIHPLAGTASTRLVNQVPDDLVVYADAFLLRRIFQNLIANAIRHTPRGVVTIGGTAIASAGVIECTVADNGVGIPAEVLEKIFDKGESFGDGDGGGAGTGLGLAIVKAFTEAHGGTVTAESTEGVGSTFRFRLPLRAPAATASALKA